VDEYEIRITGSMRGAAVQVTDPTADDKIVAEANDLTDAEALEFAAAWLRENVL
jgi:hypothetical protein